MLEQYLIQYSIKSLAESFFIKVSLTDIFAYSKDRGYLVIDEAVNLVVNELALAIMHQWQQIDLELETISVNGDVDTAKYITGELNFGNKLIQCYASERGYAFLQEQLLIKPLSLVKIAPIQINYTTQIMCSRYMFKSNKYLYTLSTRQMYIAIKAIINGRNITFYVNRILVHKLYTQYYSGPAFATHYELAPLLHLSGLLELWLRDEYKFELIIEQIKLVYLSQGTYLKVDCLVDDKFCGYILLDSTKNLDYLVQFNNGESELTVPRQNKLIMDLTLQLPLNIGSCELVASEVNNLAVGDVVLLDGYGPDAKDNALLRLDFGKTGFIASLDNKQLTLQELI